MSKETREEVASIAGRFLAVCRYRHRHNFVHLIHYTKSKAQIFRWSELAAVCASALAQVEKPKKKAKKARK